MPEVQTQRTLSIGVDLGGTKTEAVVLSRIPDRGKDGQQLFDVLARRRIPTDRERGYEAILAATAELIGEVAREAACNVRDLPIGVGMPGSITRHSGLVKNSNTLCLNGRPFREDLSRIVGQGIVFENDANCFALAEAEFGAAQAARDGVVFGVILGTGVGGGVVVNGRVWPGPQNLGGEWGHHVVGPWRRQGSDPEASAGRDLGLGLSERERCYCGKMGCVELYASGPAVERDYRRRSGRALTMREIAAQRASDPHAERALDEMLEAFGCGIANVINILDPSCIVLGGGVSNMDILYTEGVERVRRYVFNDALTTPIVKNALGDSSGVFGAALLGE